MNVSALAINDGWQPWYGLGSTPSLVSSSGGLISAGTSVGVATGALAAGGTLATFGALAGPIGAIAGTLIGIMQQVFSGCGQTCVETSNYANQIEPVLLQNVNAYLASGRTKSEQAAALANFDYVWSKLQQFCGSGQFGAAGQRCITDRQAGACTWKASPPSWTDCVYTPAGPSGSGSACWNWVLGYRDPIAKDPCVVPDAPGSADIAGAVNSILGTSGLSSYIPLLLVGGAVILLVTL